MSVQISVNAAAIGDYRPTVLPSCAQTWQTGRVWKVRFLDETNEDNEDSVAPFTAESHA